MTPDGKTTVRRTPLQVAEADLLEAHARLTEQETRIRVHEAHLAEAKQRRHQLARTVNWRARNPILDDTENPKVLELLEDLGYRDADLSALPEVEQ